MRKIALLTVLLVLAMGACVYADCGSCEASKAEVAAAPVAAAPAAEKVCGKVSSVNPVEGSLVISQEVAEGAAASDVVVVIDGNTKISKGEAVVTIAEISGAKADVEYVISEDGKKVATVIMIAE